MPELSKKDFNAMVRELGKHSDSELGRMFGITRQRVGGLRKERGIPVFKSRDGNKETLSTCVTKADINRTSRAMKKIGEPNRSKYIRNAIKGKNQEVLND